MLQINFHQKIIVLNEQGKLLTLKRKFTNKKWDLPGGAVDFPETHVESLQRELKEETGLILKGFTIIDLQTVYADDGSYMIFAAFKTHSDQSDIELSNEHTDYKWVSKKEFLNIDATDYLKDLVGRVL